jgi:hypothetical protein
MTEMTENKKEERSIVIKLDPVQFKDLLLTIDYVTNELKNIDKRLVAIEGELKLIRIKVKDNND